MLTKELTLQRKGVRVEQEDEGGVGVGKQTKGKKRRE